MVRANHTMGDRKGFPPLPFKFRGSVLTIGDVVVGHSGSQEGTPGHSLSKAGGGVGSGVCHSGYPYYH